MAGRPDVADINRVVLVGRLTRDAELKYTNSGYAICKFSIAINRRRKVDDNWTDEANFFDIDLWGKSAEAIAQYLVRGKQVGIDGELRQDRWEQEDGQKRSKVKITAFNVQLLGSKSDGVAPGPSPSPAATYTQGGDSRPVGGVQDNFEDDDIPF
jgi:single-strand DNA-binding protein